MPEGAIDLAQRTLAWTAGLLFLLAGALWWRAGSTPLTIDPYGSADTTIRPTWWLGVALGVVVALAVGSVLARYLPVGRVLVGVAAVAVVLAGAGTLIWWRFLPTPLPVTALGPAVSATLLGFAAALFGCLLLGLASCLRGATRPSAPRPSSRRSAVVSATLALTLTGLVGTVVIRLDSEYQLRSNEYRSAGDVDRPAGAAYRSRLTGEKGWQLQVPGIQFGAIATHYGLALVSGTSVVAVDGDTGAQRWRYARADTVGTPKIAALEGGRRVLVWWDPASPFVLDARTGRRLAHWHWPAGQTVLLGDPLVVQRPTEGASALVELTSSGRDSWSLELGGCDHPYVRRDGGMLLVSLLDTCHPAHSRVLQLTVNMGSVRWTAEGIGGPVLAEGATIALLSTRNDQSTVLTALRLRDGTTAWSRAVPFPDRTRPCDDMVVAAAAHVAMIACAFELTDPDFNAHGKGLWVELDLDTGRLLRSKLYDRGFVESMAIDAGGRIVITYDNVLIGCTVAELTSRGNRPLFHPGDECHCPAIQVIVRGEQVILLDHQTETISSLR